MLTKYLLATCLASLALVPSCGEPVAETIPTDATSAKTLPESYWLDRAPADALDIRSARASSVDGAEVVIVGRVGDLLDRRAQFELVDRAFVPCNERPEDECQTPWDYCCEDATELASGTIIVECRDGVQLRKVTARGFHGLDHLQEVVVRGKVVKDAAGNLIVVATGLHIDT